MEKKVEPDPSILDGCEKLSSDLPAYKTEHFIVEADTKYILKAVALVKCIESNVYPIMLDMMGHTPTVNLHFLHFVDHRRRGCTGTSAWFQGIEKFRDTYYVGSRIKIFRDQLTKENILHETIHGLLDEAKNSRCRTKKWKPIWKKELLDLIFEMELYRRLGNEMGSTKRYDKRIKQGGNYAVFAEFWKDYGWEPFKSLIVCLHNDPNFPTAPFDEKNFTYYMSLFTKKDVSGFFEKHCWNIDNKTKEKIREELQRNR